MRERGEGRRRIAAESVFAGSSKIVIVEEGKAASSRQYADVAKKSIPSGSSRAQGCLA